MKRRNFIKSAALGSVSLSVSSSLIRANPFSFDQEVKGFPYRTLGKTGEKVSVLGIGGWQTGTDTVPREMAVRMVQRAWEIGINYLDTAPNYGNSEEKFGIALESKRKDFIIATKTEEATYDGTWKLLEQSLNRLKTDYIDIVNFHSIGNLKRFPDINVITGKQGGLNALLKAKEQGIIKYIGATGHNAPSRFHKLLDTGNIDVLMNAVNYVVQHSYDFENRLWCRAHEKNIGLIGMKILGGGDPKPKGYRLPHDSYDSAIRYALSLPGLATMVIGMENVDELEKAAGSIKSATVLSEEEQMELYVKGLEILKANDTWKAPYGGPVV